MIRRHFVASAVVLGVGAAVLGCFGGTNLDTRSFELRHLEDSVAMQLIEPYVYGDREGAPGTLSAVQGILTVRETRDNLDRISRVLEQFDQPRKSVSLNFQIIFGNGGTTTDPAIAEVVTELRKLFRFEGYELRSEGSVTGLERTEVFQTMFDEASGDTGFGRYELQATIGSVVGPPDSAVVELSVRLFGDDMGLFNTSLVLGVGHTVVLGTFKLPGSGAALILTVRAELAE